MLVTLMSSTSFCQQIAREKSETNPRGYLEYLPPGYSSSSDLYPCIIFLHGSGERGDGSLSSLSKVSVHGTPKFLKNGGQLPFIVLSPQQSTGRSGWTNDVIPFIKWAIKKYSIDSTRIFITGLSMGGYGSWTTAYGKDNLPNYIRAIAPVSGNGDYNGGKVVAQRGIQAWVFWGDRDTTTPRSEAERPYKGMLTQNPVPKPRFQVIPGGGHNSSTWDKVFTTNYTEGVENIYTWFLSFESLLPKDPEPLIPGLYLNGKFCGTDSCTVDNHLITLIK